MFSTLCQAMHNTMVAGKCPWCGQMVNRGRAFPDDLHLVLATIWPTAREEPRPRAESTDNLLEIIEQMDRGAGKAIPLLISALRDPDEAVREAAASALGRIGPDAKDALPGLFILLDDEDILVRDAAQEAISRIEAKA